MGIPENHTLRKSTHQGYTFTAMRAANIQSRRIFMKSLPVKIYALRCGLIPIAKATGCETANSICKTKG
jgi:hypothetical protein